MDFISQIIIVIFGGIAIWLVSCKAPLNKWGYIFGIISQPFWLYVTFSSKQYGMFALSVWYTFGWAKGIYNYFYKETVI